MKKRDQILVLLGIGGSTFFSEPTKPRSGGGYCRDVVQFFGHLVQPDFAKIDLLWHRQVHAIACTSLEESFLSHVLTW
jgi:hypothetical protein